MRRFESCRPSQTAGNLEIRNGKKCVKLEQTERQDENPRFDLIRRERIGTAAKPLARRAKGRKPGVILPPQPNCRESGNQERQEVREVGANRAAG